MQVRKKARIQVKLIMTNRMTVGILTCWRLSLLAIRHTTEKVERMKQKSFMVAVSFLFAAAAVAETTITVTPSTPVFDANNVTGVPLDNAPGFPFGSFASNGSGKTDMYFTPAALFGRAVTLGEIESISYWTKTGATHVADFRDWYLVIYTVPYSGDVSSSTWYGDRIGAEPYFSASLNDPANTWNLWSTDGPDNRLRFFESTAGYFGGYSDLHWDDFVLGNGLSGAAYAPQEILFLSVQTGSAWAGGFTGQVDGVRIELTDGSVAKINFEPFLVATDASACKKGGWQGLTRADGSTFKNQGDCIQYVNTGK
jgi:hypothetical protein